jgi:hypothetical protein
MKKSILSILILFVFSLIYFSCSKSSNPVSGPAPTYTITNNYKREINKGIPVVDTLSIVEDGNLLSLNFSLDTVLAIDGTQKLDVVLLHNNIVDTLINHFTNTVSSYNFRGCICSDIAASYFLPGQTNYTGMYKPYSPLSVFNGQPVTGKWYLIFSYPTLNKTGVIKSWSITITYNSPSPPPSNIHPLSVGNYWQFAIDTGNVTNYSYTTLYVNGTAKIHGKEVFRWQWQNDANYWYLRPESDGLWWYGWGNGNSIDTTTAPSLWMKYPIDVNETFITKQWIMNVDTIKCTGKNVTFSSIDSCVMYSEYSTFIADNDNRKFSMFFNPYLTKGVNSHISANTYFRPGTGYSGNEITTITSTAINFQRYRLIAYHVQ